MPMAAFVLMLRRELARGAKQIDSRLKKRERLRIREGVPVFLSYIFLFQPYPSAVVCLYRTCALRARHGFLERYKQRVGIFRRNGNEKTA